jgi:ribosomal protein L11 methyltransferase
MRPKNKKRERQKSGDWTSGITAMDVGRDLRIIPHWESWDTRADRLNIISDPGPSFGGANHPTTIMALELIEKVFREESSDRLPRDFLDIGTGTGILAIAASALSATLCVGVDPDPVAIYTAKRNIRLNEGIFPENSQGPHMIIGDASCIGRGFHIVAANLIGPLLIQIRPRIEGLVAGMLIISGIGDHIRERVLGEYESGDLKLVEARAAQGWNAALLKRKEEAAH